MPETPGIALPPKEGLLMPNPARPSRMRARVSDRLIASGLAVAACLGLAAVIGVRASQADGEPAEGLEPVTSDGLTRADVEAYAEQLADERLRLSTYREQLSSVAETLAVEMEAFNDSVDAADIDTSGVREAASSLEDSGGNQTWRPTADPDTSSYSS